MVKRQPVFVHRSNGAYDEWILLRHHLLPMCGSNAADFFFFSKHVLSPESPGNRPHPQTANNLGVDKLCEKMHVLHKETVELSFADAKQHHGHRYARFRGLSKVQMQCLLAATAQNVKKMALLCAFLVAINREIWRWRGCKRGRNLLAV